MKSLNLIIQNKKNYQYFKFLTFLLNNARIINLNKFFHLINNSKNLQFIYDKFVQNKFFVVNYKLLLNNKNQSKLTKKQWVRKFKVTSSLNFKNKIKKYIKEKSNFSITIHNLLNFYHYFQKTQTYYIKIFLEKQLPKNFNLVIHNINYDLKFKTIALNYIFKNIIINKMKISKFLKNKLNIHYTSLIYSFLFKDLNIILNTLISLLGKTKKQWPYFYFIKNLITQLFTEMKNVNGLRLQISGKLNGRRRKIKKYFRWGLLPLQSFNKNLNYVHKVAKTKYGTIGIKLWIYLT